MPSLFDDHVSIRDLTASSAVIIHAPHGGRAIPAAHRGAFTIDDVALEAELDALTDHDTDEIAAAVPGVSLFIDGLSRFVVDVERFPDETEEKNTVGMGVLYTHGSWREHIRTVGPEEQETLMGFFGDYSAALAALTASALEHHGRALIIDLHSFTKEPLPHELHALEARPELCLGFEEYHATPELLETVSRAFGWLEQRSNEPFHGSYVPLDYYRRDPRVQSVMLEVRRDVVEIDAARIAESITSAAALFQSASRK